MKIILWIIGIIFLIGLLVVIGAGKLISICVWGCCFRKSDTAFASKSVRVTKHNEALKALQIGSAHEGNAYVACVFVNVKVRRVFGDATGGENCLNRLFA